jgi:hypothetical protein
MKYTVVTTFNADGYNTYGRRMIETFLKTWPRDILFKVYAEGCTVTETAPNLEVLNLEGVSADLVTFKNKWRNVPKANGDIGPGSERKAFKWQAVRFAHKVYAIFHAAKNCTTDWLIWMDADMVCHTPITLDFIASQLPAGTGLAFLGREKKFTECGLYGMNLQDSITRTWLKEFQLAYDSGRLMTMAEWNDCWVFDETRKEVQAANPAWQQLNWSAGLIKGEGHPLINTAWGAYLDHLKGKRKENGQSLAKDLIQPRTEGYWSSVSA